MQISLVVFQGSMISIISDAGVFNFILPSFFSFASSSEMSNYKHLKQRELSLCRINVYPISMLLKISTILLEIHTYRE